jgi:hypothetical protein
MPKTFLYVKDFFSATMRFRGIEILPFAPQKCGRVELGAPEARKV